MEHLSIPVPAQWLGIVIMIATGIQGIKRWPFLGILAEKYLGTWWPMLLAAIAAFLQAVILYGGDSVLTAGEMVQVVVTTLSAMGLHLASKTIENKTGVNQ